MDDISPKGTPPLAITVLSDAGDERGAKFALPTQYLDFLGTVGELHVAEVLPGRVRGNHFHATRDELLLVVHRGAWSLHWDSGADTEVESRVFDGPGVVAVTIKLGAAHALRNDSDEPVWIVAASNGRYDPVEPDAYRRAVIAA